MNTQELARANKVTVLVTPEGMTARFVRTHRLITEVDSKITGFTPIEGKTKTAQREAFRDFVIEHANQYGVDWKPEKMSTMALPNKYADKEQLLDAAVLLVTPDITKWVEDLGNGLEVSNIMGTYVSEVDEYNGREVSPRYNNGNYAYANIGIEIQLKSGDQEAVVTMECLLVSGQMKKPTKIGDNNYNMTNFKAEINEQLPELFKKPEEPKIEVVEDSKVEEPKKKKSKKSKQKEEVVSE